jgi:hypothetical protein
MKNNMQNLEPQTDSLYCVIIAFMFYFLQYLLNHTPELQLIAISITIISGSIAIILNLPKLIKLVKSFFQ